MLEKIRDQVNKPSGKYHTDLDRWTCSCPAYLLSRFLLCKHLVRAVDRKLTRNWEKDLTLFYTIEPHHTPPFYRIHGLHSFPTACPAPQKPVTRPTRIDLHDATATSIETDVETAEEQHVPTDQPSQAHSMKVAENLTSQDSERVIGRVEENVVDVEEEDEDVRGSSDESGKEALISETASDGEDTDEHASSQRQVSIRLDLLT